MITEIVRFKLPAGMSRDEYLRRARDSIATWRGCPDMVRKNYLYDPKGGFGGGIYLWDKLDAALAWHGESFKARIRSVYGSDPEFTYFETPWVIDNRAGEFVQDEVGEAALRATAG
jgi:hypothetical protein